MACLLSAHAADPADHARKKRRKIRYDVAMLFHPDKYAAFEAYLQGVPTVPYGVDPTSHCAIIDEYVLNGQETVLPLKTKPKVQEYISDAT